MDSSREAARPSSHFDDTILVVKAKRKKFKYKHNASISQKAKKRKLNYNSPTDEEEAKNELRANGQTTGFYQPLYFCPSSSIVESKCRLAWLVQRIKKRSLSLALSIVIIFISFSFWPQTVSSEMSFPMMSGGSGQPYYMNSGQCKF